MEAVDVRGRFVWHELLTRDVAAATKFYSKIVGWTAQPWPRDPRYTVCLAGDVPTASMQAMAPEFPADVPSQWMPYIGTRDVDGTAEAAVLAGGYIVKQPADLPGAGRYAVLADPQGAVFAIIDPEQARPESGEPMPPLQHFTWHELATSDAEQSFSFYSNLFGWEAITRMDMGPAGVYLIFGQNGLQKGGIYIKPPDMPAQPAWLTYVHVPSVDDSAGDIEAAGGKVTLAPMEVPGGSRIVMIQDPGGARFALNSFPGAKPAAEPAVTAKATRPKPAVKAKAKAKARSKPKVKTKLKTKAKARPRLKTKAKAAAKAKSKSKLKARARKSAARVKFKKKPARRKK